MLIGCITVAVIYPFAVENALSTNRLADSLCLTDAKRHNRTLCKLVQTAEPDTDIYQPVLGWQELLSVETVKNVKPMKLNKTKPNKPPPFLTYLIASQLGWQSCFLPNILHIYLSPLSVYISLYPSPSSSSSSSLPGLLHWPSPLIPSLKYW